MGINIWLLLNIVSKALYFGCDIFIIIPFRISLNYLSLLRQPHAFPVRLFLSFLIACLHFFFWRCHIDNQIMRCLIFMKTILRLVLTPNFICQWSLLSLMVDTVFFSIMQKFFIVVVVWYHGRNLGWRGWRLMRMLVKGRVNLKINCSKLSVLN